MATKSKYVGGKLTFFDPAKKYIYTRRETRYQWHDDFDTYTSVPEDGSKANGVPWVLDLTGAAPPTGALTADAAGGVYTMSLTATSEAQDSTIHFDDYRHISLDRAPIFQCYAQMTTLPTLLGIASIGLASDHNAGGQVGTTINVGFQISASGAVGLRIDDDVTPVTAASVATLTVSTYYCFRIDCTDKTNIKFSIDGAIVGGSTTFSMAAATGADAILQPFIGVSKASGAGLGVLVVDSVDIWQD